MIRLPEFVTRAEFDWAVQEATTKKKKDFSKVEFFTYDEGLCMQCMHIPSRGPCGSWMRLQRNRDIARIFQTHASITRSIWEIHAAPHRRS